MAESPIATLSDCQSVEFSGAPLGAAYIKNRDWRPALVAGLIATSVIGCRPQVSPNPSTSQSVRNGIYGQVTSAGLPIDGIRVRIKGTSLSTRTAADGTFALDVAIDVDDPQVVTASKQGFFIQGTTVKTLPVALKLDALPTYDDEAYEWVDPTPDETTSLNCGNCHQEIYQEWNSGGHADSTTNRRFLDLYAGTDWHGNPEVGWNLLKDYPEGAGVCNACHAPAASLDELAVSDIRDIEGVARMGVHCDFCHKIQDTTTKALGLTHGRFGVSLLRPSHDQLFFGPLDDVDRGEDTYSPLQSQSQFLPAAMRESYSACMSTARIPSGSKVPRVTKASNVKPATCGRRVR